jgi:hypothetical protein
MNILFKNNCFVSCKYVYLFTIILQSSHRGRHIYMKKATSIFYLVQGFGFIVLYDPVGRIYIKLEPYYIGRVHGLCGNNDGDPADFVPNNGIAGSKDDFFDSFKSPACAVKKMSGDDLVPCSIYATTVSASLLHFDVWAAVCTYLGM